MDVATDPVETAALGCLVERSSTSAVDDRSLMIISLPTRLDDIAGAFTGGAKLRRTAEGGCPHMVFAGFRTSGALAPTLVLADG